MNLGMFRLQNWFGWVVAFGMLSFGGGVSADQVATPTMTPSHPAHIHAGACDTLGDVVFPLQDLSVQPPATPVASDTTEVMSAGAESTTTVEVSLDDMLASEHAINIHESAENIGNYIACGNVSGDPVDGMLEIQLDELNNSGFSGAAMLQDNGDGTTTVTVSVVHTTSSSTPDAAAATPESVTIEIVNLAYSPQSITIPAGGSITWVNNDAMPHTATGLDRDVLQSGTLKQGERFTQTFDTPGTYEYFCEFHANMKGTIIVK